MTIATEAAAVDAAIGDLVAAVAALRSSVDAEISAQAAGTSSHSAARNVLGDVEALDQALADAIVGRCGLRGAASVAATRTGPAPSATALADRLARYS